LRSSVRRSNLQFALKSSDLLRRSSNSARRDSTELVGDGRVM
jgi:hypothetical protein